MEKESNGSHLRLKWWGMTHVGRYRKNNEDAFLAVVFDAAQANYLGKTGEADFTLGDFVFAVSDGMGGANAGEFASRIAVDKITELLPRSYRLAQRGMHAGKSDIIHELFPRIHDEIREMSRNYEEVRGMGATLTLAWFSPDWMFFGHVGDSRIYYLPKGGGMKQITHDHSYVGSLFRKGKINEREARNHPQKHEIEQALGANLESVDPQVGSVGYEPGDRFLLCTDGLCDGLWDNGLQKILRTPMPWLTKYAPAEALVRESLSESGRDNLTAVVVEILESES